MGGSCQRGTRRASNPEQDHADDSRVAAHADHQTPHRNRLHSPVPTCIEGKRRARYLQWSRSPEPALAELTTTSANILTEVADAADATVAWSPLDQYEPDVLISSGAIAAAIIGSMLDMSHRVVVEQHGGDVCYTLQPSDIRFEVRLPMDWEAPRKVLRPPEARS